MEVGDQLLVAPVDLGRQCHQHHVHVEGGQAEQLGQRHQPQPDAGLERRHRPLGDLAGHGVEALLDLRRLGRGQIGRRPRRCADRRVQEGRIARSVLWRLGGLGRRWPLG
jgi:hypothetical protein